MCTCGGCVSESPLLLWGHDDPAQSYLEADLALLPEVRLVADQHDHYVSRRQLLLQVLQPLLSLAEGVLGQKLRRHSGAVLSG